MYRVKNNNNVFGGVCQGLAEHFNADVTLVRVLFVLLFFTPVPIGIAYLVMWAFLPLKNNYSVPVNDENNFNVYREMNNQYKSGNIIGGLILIALGIIFSMKTFFNVNIFEYLKNLWPLVFIAIGVWIILKERDNQPPIDPGERSDDFNNGGSTTF